MDDGLHAGPELSDCKAVALNVLAPQVGGRQLSLLFWTGKICEDAVAEEWYSNYELQVRTDKYELKGLGWKIGNREELEKKAKRTVGQSQCCNEQRNQTKIFQ